MVCIKKTEFSKYVHLNSGITFRCQATIARDVHEVMNHEFFVLERLGALCTDCAE